MPLGAYGVAVGTFVDFFRDPEHHFGQWYHGHVRVQTPAGTYEAALDVDAPASVGVSYRVVDDLTIVDIAPARALADGFHRLLASPASGALDYVRSPLLRNSFWFAEAQRLGWELRDRFRPVRPGEPGYRPDAGDRLAARLGSAARNLARPGLHRRVRYFPWVPSNGDNALDVLEPHLRASSRLYLFGQAFDTGLGVHDVHLNQGDPQGSPWYATDGVWQDGAVLCELPDGRVLAWQVRFNTQSLNTDGSGHPR